MPASLMSNTAVASLARLLHVALGLFITGILTRYLGSAGFGSYSVVLSFGLLLLTFTDLGLYLTLTREISKHPEREAHFLSQSVWLRLIAASLVFSLGLIIAKHLAVLQSLTVPYLLITLGLTAQSISQLFMGVFQRHATIWRASLGDIAGRILQIIAIIFLAYVVPLQTQAAPGLSDRIMLMALVFTGSTLAALLIHWILAPSKPRLRHPIVWSDGRYLLKHSWPLALMLVLNMIYFRSDTLILSLFRPAAEVGHYSLAYRLIESALFFPAMFGGLLFPRLSRAVATQNWPKAKALLRAGFEWQLLCAALAVIMLVFLAHPLIVFLSGPEFAPAAPLLVILSLALAAMFLGNLFGFALVALEKQFFLMALYAALAFLNVAATFMLVPRFGAPAAAWVTVATELTASGLAGILVYRLLPFPPPLKYLSKLGLLTLLSAGVLYLSQPLQPFILPAGLALAVFGLGAVGLRLLEPASLRTLFEKHAISSVNPAVGRREVT